MDVVINKEIYQKASVYANRHGVSLATIIEKFLMNFIIRNERTNEQQIPEIVNSLLGAGISADNNDLNARKAYYKYIEDKHK